MSKTDDQVSLCISQQQFNVKNNLLYILHSMEFWVVKFSSEGYKVFGKWFYFLNRHRWAVKKCQNLTFHVKNHLELSDFFSLNITSIAYFMLSTFFDEFTFWNTFLRWCLIFDGSVLFLFTNYNNFLQFFWPKIYLLLYPSLGNLTTHIAIIYRSLFL